MNKRTHLLTRDQALQSIEIRGIPTKIISINVCGKKIAELSTDGIQKLDDIRGNNDKPESKRTAISYLLRNANDNTIHELLDVFDLEKALAVLITPDEMGLIDQAREFDCPKQNERDYLQNLLKKIIEPKGMEVIVRNEQVGMEAVVSFRGITTKI